LTFTGASRAMPPRLKSGIASRCSSLVFACVD
jgi:hypothetical protein